MAVFANLVGRLTLDSTAFDRNARRSSQSMRAMQRESLALHKGIVELAGAYFAFRTAARMVQSLTREAVAFEYQMAKVNTMLDRQTAQYLPGLEKGIRQLAKTYGESTASLSQGTYDILSAGIDASDAMKVLEASVRAAKGGFTDAAVTTRAMVGLLNAYQLEARQAERVTDFLHAVVKEGVITFEELAQNIGTVSSLAAVLGVDMEAIGASIATITKAGVPAEIAMTALRSILNTFKNPTQEARAAAAELGFTLDETSIKGAGLVEIMQNLKDANAEQLEALMPNVRGLVGFAAQMKNATGLAESYARIVESAGRSQEAWNKVSETTQQRLSVLEQRWRDVKIELGTPISEFVVDQLEAFADGLQSISKAAQAAHRSVSAFYSIPEVGKGGAVFPGLAMPGAFETGRGTRFEVRRPGPLFQEPEETGFEAWAEIQRKRMESQFQTYQDAVRLQKLGEAFKGSWYQSRGLKAPGETETGGAEAATKTTTDITAAYRRMYNDIDRKSEESWQIRRELLLSEYREYANVMEDKQLLFKWLAEQQIKLAREQAIATGSLAEGFAARIQQMKDELQTIGEVGADLADRLRDGLVNSLTDAVFEAKDLSEALKNVTIDMGKLLYQWALQQTFQTGMGLLFHGGGTVGGGVQVRRPAPVPISAPRFHDGGEVPAWLLPGEHIQSRQEVGATDRSMGRMVQLLERIAGREQDGGTTVIVARTPDEVHEAMASREGRRIIVDATRRAGLGGR